MGLGRLAAVKMKHILYMSRGKDIAGSQRQLLYLVDRLRNHFTPIVVCSEPGEFVNELKRRQIEVVVMSMKPWRKMRNVIGRYSDLKALEHFAGKQNIEMVHCSYLWHSPYAMRVAENLSVPVVLHIRCPLSPSQIKKYKCGQADAVIAISRKIEKQLLSAAIPAEKVACVEDAVDTEWLKYCPARNLRQENKITNSIVFGLVGRVCRQKRQMEFVYAAKKILEKGYDAYFIIIGEEACDSYTGMLRQYINEHGLTKRVLLAGRREDMPEILSSLDVLVSLSGGSVMFEAMACGRTVISAGFTQKEDAVHLRDGETGILLSTLEIETLASAMMRAADNSELRKLLGSNAENWVKSHLSVENMVKKTQQLYERLLK